jgi:hypothetical protein
MSKPLSSWWQRTGVFAAYPEELQGSVPHCVYAAIAGAVNHLTSASIWTPKALFDEHQKNGPRPTDFSVADTALIPVANTIQKHHHLKGVSVEALSPDLIRTWLASGHVVILSRELRNDAISKQGGWHMITIVAYGKDGFQVWDTNGFKGFLTDGEIDNGFYYPNGWFFMPHDQEDTLLLKK